MLREVNLVLRFIEKLVTSKANSSRGGRRPRMTKDWVVRSRGSDDESLRVLKARPQFCTEFP